MSSGLAGSLTKVYPPEGSTDATSLDLIVVHGLGADPKTAWVAQNAKDGEPTDEKAAGGVAWLSHPKMMPAFVPNAQIWTFNYSSDRLQGSLIQWLRMLAEQLLMALDHCRQALTFAGTADSSFQHILHAAAGVVFLGSPLRGPNSASWARVIANSARVLGFEASDSLMGDVNAASKMLTDLLYDFRVTICRPWLQLTIVCFYEQLRTSVFEDSWFLGQTEIMVVDEASACIEGHRKIPLRTSHVGMNKFSQPDDGNFQLVATCIRELADRAPDVLQARCYELEKLLKTDNPSKTSIPRLLEEMLICTAPVDASFRECMTALFQTEPLDDHMQTREIGGERVDSACKWVLQQESFTGWLLSQQTAILWVTGGPATGKTTIASFLVDEMSARARQSADMMLAYYFCGATDDRRNTAESILRSLLMQILQQRPELFRHLEPEFDAQKAVLFTSGNAVHAMWRILRKILNDPKSRDVYIIIDALDECEAESRHAFISRLEDLFSLPFGSVVSDEDSEAARSKILITTRPLHRVEEQLKGVDARFMHIEVDSGNKGLEDFIEAKIALLATKSYPPDLLDRVKEHLKGNTGGTFLGVSLVLDELSRTPLSKADMTLRQAPVPLNQIYERTIHQIDGEHIGAVRKILLWVATATRPMTTAELAAATMPGPQADAPRLPEGKVLEIFLATLSLCQPLVKVREKIQTVHFIHQTVKDYLVETNIVPPPPQANFAVFLDCSEYLSACLGTKVSSSSGPPDDRMPCLGYVYVNWPRHARLSGGEALTNTDWVRGWFLLDPEKREALFNQCGPGLFSDTEVLRKATLLHISAYLGLTHILMAIDDQGLLGNGISTRDNSGHTPLHWAAEMGHGETVKLLLQMGSNVHTRDDLRDNPLHAAVARSYGEVVEVLLENEANPDSPGRNHRLPLHQAAEMGDVKIIKTLLAHHADVNGCLPDMTTPLHLAARWGHAPAILELLSAGANINAFQPFGESALHAAVRNGHEEATLALLERGANVHALTSDESSPNDIVPREGKMHYRTHTSTANWTPLHIAAKQGRRQICEILLLYGADPMSQTMKGKTPLQVAAEELNEEVAELLMEADSSLTANDILQAAIQCQSYRLVQSFFADPSDLIDIGAALSLAAESGNLALTEITCDKFTPDQVKRAAFSACSTALRSDRPDILEVLFRSGADIQAKGPWRKTLLHLAVEADNLDLAAFLINHGIDLSAQDGSKYTPLHVAVERKNKDMVAILLHAGAPADIVDVERCTPLHFAAHAGAGDIVAMLVDEAGADMEKRDADGRTALDLATAKGHLGVQHFLEDRKESEWMTDDGGEPELAREDQSGRGPGRIRRVTASGQRVMSGSHGSRIRTRRSGQGNAGRPRTGRSARGSQVTLHAIH